MNLNRWFSAAKKAALTMTVLAMLLYIGCKSKKSQGDRGSGSSAAVSAAEAEKLRRENARLKTALEEANCPTSEHRPETAGGEIESPSYPDQDKVDAVISAYSAATSTEEKLKLLARLGALVHSGDPVVIVLIESALQDPDVRVNRAGADLLEDFETAQALPAIEKALNSSDPETRELAVVPLANIRDPKATELLTIALEDESEDVRQAAFDSLDEQSPGIRLEVLETAIGLSHYDVKRQAVDGLEDLGNHRALEILLLGLKDPDPDFRDEVNQSLDYLIDQKFESYEQGLAWWNENRAKLDEDLFPLEEKEEE